MQQMHMYTDSCSLVCSHSNMKFKELFAGRLFVIWFILYQIFCSFFSRLFLFYRWSVIVCCHIVILFLFNFMNFFLLHSRFDFVARWSIYIWTILFEYLLSYFVKYFSRLFVRSFSGFLLMFLLFGVALRSIDDNVVWVVNERKKILQNDKKKTIRTVSYVCYDWGEWVMDS